MLDERFNNGGELLLLRARDRRVAFDVEGSRVRLHLILNERLARGGNPITVPFKYNFEFVVLKHGNVWVVEKSDGYL